MLDVRLLIIDPQGSFCNDVPQDQQQSLHDGELCVPGALDDMNRLAKMVDRIGHKIKDITVTMDSHPLGGLHIAHGCFFKNINTGDRPSPFTIITLDKSGSEPKIIGTIGSDTAEYVTAHPSFRVWTLEYLDNLETSGRYPHCIWPEHCIIGTPGHLIVPELRSALHNWGQLNNGFVNVVTKGSNFRTEHFSAVRAEVPVPNDPTTQLNTDVIETFLDADLIGLSGEARSHCLANTVRDIANEFVSGGQFGTNDEFIKKCVLLTDASSDVPTFEKLGNDFVDEMTSRGMKTATTTDWLS